MNWFQFYSNWLTLIEQYFNYRRLQIYAYTYTHAYTYHTKPHSCSHTCVIIHLHIQAHNRWLPTTNTASRMLYKDNILFYSHLPSGVVGLLNFTYLRLKFALFLSFCLLCCRRRLEGESWMYALNGKVNCVFVFLNFYIHTHTYTYFHISADASVLTSTVRQFMAWTVICESFLHANASVKTSLM